MSDQPARRAMEAIAAQPWAMTEEAIALMLEIAAREHEITPEALEGFRARRVAGADTLSIRDGVGIISARGPMFRYGSFFTAISGGATYDGLATDIMSAVGNPNLKAILLSIDSPGGEVNGLSELAAMVRKASTVKPIVAYIGGTGASAAYWLASAASSVWASDVSMIGSIGVRMAMRDSSERDAKSGIKTIEFVSSQSPHKISDPTTDAGKAKIQRTVDSLASVFISAVATNRGVTEQDVLAKFGAGGVEVGADAVAAGMIDGISSFEEVLAKLSRADLITRPTLGAPKPKGTLMTDISKADHDAAVAAARAEGAAQARAEGEKAGAAQAQARIASIMGLEEAKGRTALANHFAFKTAMSVDDAKAALGASALETPPAAPAAPTGQRSAGAKDGLVQVETGLPEKKAEAVPQPITADKRKAIFSRV